MQATGNTNETMNLQSGTSAGFGDFFKYHGWLSPGVRLFRSIRFQAKAMWVSLAFVAPLLMTLFYLWSATNRLVEEVSFFSMDAPRPQERLRLS